MNRNDFTMCSCKNIKYLPTNKYICSNQSTCLIVPVSIHRVCENSYLLVIVEVFKDNKFYARKIKEVFTGYSKNDKSNCSSNNNLIDCLFIDNFKFYFIDDCNPKCIHVEVITQYIYDCL